MPKRKYLDEVTASRKRMPSHPKKRTDDEKAYDEYKAWEEERQQQEQERKEIEEQYAEYRAKQAVEREEKISHDKDVVMSSLHNVSNSLSDIGAGIEEASDKEREDRIEEWKKYKNMIDATMTAGELTAAGYGVVRGLTHLNRLRALRATQTIGNPVSREALRNLVKWNRRVTAVDKPQILMNTIGGVADGYQWLTANNSFDALENGLETGANFAGVIGGTNWFKNLPYLRYIGGNTIDSVLDGLGYGAAGWDIVKNFPPLSTALENIRNKTKALDEARPVKKSGGSIHIKPSHRGRLTELKARTGKSEAELYSDGNPAHKKMVVFARNARKWKH